MTNYDFAIAATELSVADDRPERWPDTNRRTVEGWTQK